MGLEWRWHRLYYYEKQRRGSRVVSKYVAGGEFARLMADSQRLLAEQRRQQRVQVAAVRIEQQTIVTHTNVAGAHMRLLVAGVLVSNGYHQHKRQWRKAMHQEAPVADQPLMVPVRQQNDEAALQRGWEALRAALEIQAQPAKSGRSITERDKAQAELARRAAVRRALADYPVLWSQLRDLLSNGQEALIEASCGSKDSTAALLLEHTLKNLRRELGYHEAPLLEQLLIEQVVLAWLDLDMVQQIYAKRAIQRHTVGQGAYWDRRMNSAQLRYLRSIEALARVRRLAQPVPLQVNIGGQQVNVVGGMTVDTYAKRP